MNGAPSSIKCFCDSSSVKRWSAITGAGGALEPSVPVYGGSIGNRPGDQRAGRPCHRLRTHQEPGVEVVATRSVNFASSGQ